MNALLLNRDGFQMPADGWYQMAPLGEFAHAQAGLVQVVDAEACAAMADRFRIEGQAPNFAGLLVDFDHFSLDGEKRSEAAGWIVALEARGQGSGFGVQGSGESDRTDESDVSQTANAGLWAKIRWSDVGEEAVKGGRYRFLSPVWARSDCVDLGNGRVRPVRLLNAAVTNDPNLKGMLPLSNRCVEKDQRGEPVDFLHSVEGASKGGRWEVEGGGKERGGMKAVIERLVNHLGLGADASEAAILEKMAGLPAMTAVADVQNSLRDLQGKHDAVVANLKKAEGDLVNRHLAEFEGVISAESREFWAGQLLENRDGALLALGDLARLKIEDGGRKTDGSRRDAEGAEGSQRRPLHNRATARPVPPGTGAGQGGEADSKAVKIRNRAHEIAKAESLPFSLAFRRAEKEICEG